MIVADFRLLTAKIEKTPSIDNDPLLALILLFTNTRSSLVNSAYAKGISKIPIEGSNIKRFANCVVIRLPSLYF